MAVLSSLISSKDRSLAYAVAHKVTHERCPQCSQLPVHVRTIGLGLRGEKGSLLIHTCKNLHSWQEKVMA